MRKPTLSNALGNTTCLSACDVSAHALGGSNLSFLSMAANTYAFRTPIPPTPPQRSPFLLTRRAQGVHVVQEVGEFLAGPHAIVEPRPETAHSLGFVQHYLQKGETERKGEEAENSP
jgi:hypothetical protein